MGSSLILSFFVFLICLSEHLFLLVNGGWWGSGFDKPLTGQWIKTKYLFKSTTFEQTSLNQGLGLNNICASCLCILRHILVCQISCIRWWAESSSSSHCNCSTCCFLWGHSIHPARHPEFHRRTSTQLSPQHKLRSISPKMDAGFFRVSSSNFYLCIWYIII